MIFLIYFIIGSSIEIVSKLAWNLINFTLILLENLLSVYLSVCNAFFLFQANSPSEITSKVSQSSAFNTPKVDEEGYNIRPENPWATGHSTPSSSGSDSSGSSSPSEKTFKGIKVSLELVF